MNVPFRHLRAVGFVAAAVILLLSGGLAVCNLHGLIGNGRAAVHSAQTMKELETTLSLLANAETAQRNYLLTGNEASLQLYREAAGKTGLLAQVQNLRRLTAKEPAQLRHLATLQPLIVAQLRQLHEAVEVQRQHGGDAAHALVLRHLDQGTMGKNRTLIQAMEDEEDDLLDQRTDEADASAQNALRSFVVGICFSVVLLSLSGTLLQREVGQRRKAEQVARQLNCDLEGRVQQRTEKLEQAQGQIVQHASEMEAAHVEMLNRLALAGEFRDDDTGQHTLRVGTISALIAQELGLAADEVRRIQKAARLHDVGKIGVSDTILLKPAKLTDEEFALMKTHTTIGAALFENGHSELVQVAQRIAGSHHEKWDGTGYPLGLYGEAIPLEARILAVADVFDALTHERPYKKAWPVVEAVTEIERQSGHHFDPQMVRAFLLLDHQALI